MDRISPTIRPQEPVVMCQEWRHLTFLHWSVNPAEIQKLLPDGLTVDTFEGNAYIGLVPFTMRNVRPVWSPSVRGLSHFHETNVRTYVHFKGANPGVWFFSLDAANEIAVQIARTIWKLPYYFANMTLKGEGGGIAYNSRRLRPQPTPAVCDVCVVPSGNAFTAVPGTLEHFLAERYILYSSTNGKLFRGRVHHVPYPLQTASVIRLEETLIAAGGIVRPPGTTPIAHYASGVEVSVFPLQPLLAC